MAERDQCNAFRYDKSPRGHYESYFQRANHPTRPLAFWIRYTLFCAKGEPGAAVGELWGVFFDGERGEITPVKQTWPLDQCHFSAEKLDCNIASATLDDAGLHGAAQTGQHQLKWDLQYDANGPPLLFLPELLYRTPLPKAKALVGSPGAVFNGRLGVDDREVSVENWVGSQNHNWGQKHTDRYAWGQVAGFDNAPDAFLECSTARLKLGRWWSPWMTLIVLRYQGTDYKLNTLGQAVRADGKYTLFEWRFSSRTPKLSIQGTLHAEAKDFVALPYPNPPGGIKTCLNSKLASCSVALTRKGQPSVHLKTTHRAAFEILTGRSDHGVPVLEV